MPLKSSALVTLLLAQQSLAAVSLSDSIQKKFIAAGGPKKALTHLNCIIKNFQGRNIPVKKLDPADPFVERCNKIPDVRLNNLNYVVLIDYTTKSNNRRLWIIPTDAVATSTIARMYVSHGRYNTDADNTRLEPNKNTILTSRYFSNVKDSKASSTGFYVTGEKYYGENTGSDPNNPKHSMYLHGVEKGINDNSCARVTVIHGSEFVREKGTNQGMKRMSSGCFMVDFDYIEQLHDLIKSPDEHGGTALLTYGAREAALSDDYYCKI